MLLVLTTLAACGGAEPADPDWIAGREIFGTCAPCHGKGGEGGIGPAFSTVRETFPDCATQQKWISLGSEGWKKNVGDSYGATDKPIEKVMPSFDKLTDTELAQVAVYERVRFGGGDLETERIACGLG